MKPRESVAAKLNRALHAVRADLETCLEQYNLRIQARMAEIVRVLERREPSDSATPLPAPAALGAMLKRIEDLKLKPAKGRGKDLKRIDDLVAMLLDLVKPGK